ncbi:putative uncharacterized protein DDB_G0282499 [Danaus plexippus]|uniref:putative uncharacterized protein DDB_G0282499 n=1 Tax=Danaus plexippus TaxID=13037 RepID=UPI002AB20D07|nr:putative uncharacterized protein DDB_G0282499 [Danaus plexippus]
MECKIETYFKILFLLNFIINCCAYSNNAQVYGSIDVHFNGNVPNNKPISQDYHYSSGKPESYLPISLSENFYSQPNLYPSRQGSNDEVVLVIVEESMHNNANDNLLRPFYNGNEQGNYQHNGNSHEYKYNDHSGYIQNNGENTKPGYYGQNQNIPLVYNHNPGYVVNPLMIGQEIPNSWNDYNKENVEVNYIYYQNMNKNNVKPTAFTTEPTPVTTAPVTTTEYVMKLTTKKPDDGPSGLAPGHHEYIYTGDKIYIGGAPTKDTEQKPSDNDEEDFKIDVRFNKDPLN